MITSRQIVIVLIAVAASTMQDYLERPLVQRDWLLSIIPGKVRIGIVPAKTDPSHVNDHAADDAKNAGRDVVRNTGGADTYIDGATEKERANQQIDVGQTFVDWFR
jgi:hypothetical protein